MWAVVRNYPEPKGTHSEFSCLKLSKKNKKQKKNPHESFNEHALFKNLIDRIISALTSLSVGFIVFRIYEILIYGVNGHLTSLIIVKQGFEM